MKLNEDIVALHAYLCADGYVIKSKNPKYKYFHIGLRNLNQTLLKDFQKRFKKIFRLKPYIVEGRCRIGSKKIYEILTSNFGSFYSKEWKMPKLNKALSKMWLRTFFDCEGWVFCKSHQNRHIGLDSINEKGLDQIIKELNDLGIGTIRKINKKRRTYRILIYGKENLETFKKEIGFLHPEKIDKLNKAIADYIVYKWNFPTEEKQLRKFLKEILSQKVRIKKPYYLRIISKEKENLNNLNKSLKKIYNISCLIYSYKNGIGTPYYQLSINRKEEIEKLIKNKLIPNLFKEE